MSLRRKKYDGDFPGRSAGYTEGRNPFGSAGKIEQYTPSKQPEKRSARFRLEEDIYRDDSAKDRYLLTYADLITLLLGLFIILYAISNVDILKYKEMSAALGNFFGDKGVVIGLEEVNLSNMMEPIEQLKADLRSFVEEYNSSNSITFEENKRGIVIHILDKLLFTSGKSDLSQGSPSVLKRLAGILKKIPNDIRVEGHTDNVPISSKQFPSNWHLSVNRALNIAYYLISQEKLSPDRVSIVGYAEYKPIDSNSTLEGRSVNRRVDIVILNEK